VIDEHADMPLFRPRVSNARWDAEKMLARALAGSYPSAKHGSDSRAEEIAYWRGRCGFDAEPAVADERAPADLPPDADTIFRGLSRLNQKRLIHSYFLSRQTDDFRRGVHLCVLAERCIGVEFREAQNVWHKRVEGWMRRTRMQARFYTKKPKKGVPVVSDDQQRLSFDEKEAA
jgi:hypothetical protein